MAEKGMDFSRVVRGRDADDIVADGELDGWHWTLRAKTDPGRLLRSSYLYVHLSLRNTQGRRHGSGSGGIKTASRRDPLKLVQTVRLGGEAVALLGQAVLATDSVETTWADTTHSQAVVVDAELSLKFWIALGPANVAVDTVISRRSDDKIITRLTVPPYEPSHRGSLMWM